MALWNRVFGRPGQRLRTVADWRWEFGGGPGPIRVCVAVDAEREIVGHYGASTARATIDGSATCLAQVVDSMLAPEWRAGLCGGRLFVQLGRAYWVRFGARAGARASYGWPNPAALRAGCARLGYRTVHAPLPALFHNLHGATALALPRCGGSRCVLTGPVADSEADGLWREVGPELRMALVRDAAWWRWRFADAPFGYRRCAVRDASGRLKALAALRPDWCGQPILAVADYLGAAGDRDSLEALLLHAADEAARLGQARVELWLPSASPLFAHALALGYRTEPSLFTLVLEDECGALAPSWLARHWHFTIGDSDLF